MGPTYNEAKRPLEEVFIQVEEAGIMKNVPALSKYFAVCREMNDYLRPPPMSEDGTFPIGAKQSWISATELVTQDFIWLLSLPHYRFWCEVMYHRGSLDGLVSFLQEAYPSYSLDLLPRDYEITHLYHLTCRLAYLLINRIMTRVESQRDWISEKTYAKLLYNNFVISVPMMIDICAIYGQSNAKEVSHILDYIFNVQPYYKEDLHKMVANIKCVYDSIKERLCQGGAGGTLTKLRDRKCEMTPKDLEDTLLYLLDVSVSLTAFSQLCPLVTSVMHHQRLELTLAVFYTSCMPDISYHIKKLCQDESLIGSYISMVLKMNQIRYHIITLFYHCLIDSLETSLNVRNWSEEEVKDEVDSRLVILTECLGEKAFLKDFHSRYPIDIHIDRLSNLSTQIDGIKVKFIIDSLPGIVESGGGSKSVVTNGAILPPTSRNGGVRGGQGERRLSPPGGGLVSNTIFAPQPSVSSLNSQEKPGPSASPEDSIKDLKEIFPFLGEGFLQRCLEHYGNSRTQVLDAILENKLADELMSVDPELPIIPPDRPLPSRVNVFDNDEFDIMTRDTVDTSRIHRGKRKEQYKDLSAMLDDKYHVESLKSTYTELGCAWVDSELDYDDEYDDSYDSFVPLPVEEVGDTDRRTFVTPRVLEQRKGWKKNKEEVQEEEEEEEEEEYKEATGGFSRSSGFVPFVENPELARERWQQNRAAKQANRPQRDYAGKPKGQGQEESTLFDRHKKNVNKSVVSNHNRRKQAQNKRMRGLLPS